MPPELAEQIAAGEVVERPASVVKELVENAIDAGARKIEVTLEAGGRKLVRVTDDGIGMTADEARLSLKRHATSKLAAADDLWHLGTFGFRGEALPSIASVSRMSLATKARGTLAGFRLDLEGGRELDGREAGLPDGTQIEVRDLFFNTPARLKFLKTEATEAANVSEALLRLALANPDVHIKLRSNDRTVLDLPPVTVFAERVRTALGRRGAGALHQALGEENGVKVQAFVGPPEEASSTAAQHLPVRGPAGGARPLAAGGADHGLRRAAGAGTLPAGGPVPGGSGRRSGRQRAPAEAGGSLRPGAGGVRRRPPRGGRGAGARAVAGSNRP